MLTKDLSITFCGVKFPNPFCLSSSPVGNCYEMCAKAYDSGWGGIVFKTIGFFIANEVSPRFDHLSKEDTCRFNWSTQQLCENMGLRRFFE